MDQRLYHQFIPTIRVAIIGKRASLYPKPSVVSQQFPLQKKSMPLATPVVSIVLIGMTN